MSSVFTPIGDQSRRVLVLERLAAAPVDSVVTYEELSEVLGDVDRRTVQGAVNAAKFNLEKAYSKAVVAVSNTGYRIVRASEHLTLAKHHQKKSLKQLRRSRSKVDHVDYNQLTEGEKAAISLAATSIALQMDYMRRNDIRSTRIEASVAAVQKESERSAEELAELRNRLARLERGAA